MQTQNQFLDFAEQVIARHNGFGSAFEPASMVYLEDMGQPQETESRPAQNIVANLFHIRNIREENYLFWQNLTFLTQILEKRLYQRLYPSVEQQIEKAVREELPKAQEKIVKSFSRQLVRLVERGGLEQFELVKERILSEYREKENTISKEQERLFRKIENIYNSSVYHLDAHKEYQTLQKSHRVTQQNTQMLQQNHPITRINAQEQIMILDRRGSILEHSVTLMQRQEQKLVSEKLRGTGNLGLLYETEPMEAQTTVQEPESRGKDIRQEPVSREKDIRQEPVPRVEDVRQVRAETGHVTERYLEVHREKEFLQYQEPLSLTYLEENPITSSTELSVETERHAARRTEREPEYMMGQEPESRGEDIRQEPVSREKDVRQEPVSRVEDVRQMRTETGHVTERHQEMLNLTYLEESNVVESARFPQNSAQQRTYETEQRAKLPSVRRSDSSDEGIQELILKGQAQILHQISNQMLAPRTIQSIVQNIALVTQKQYADIRNEQPAVYSANLEYSTEEKKHLHQEIKQIVQSEVNRVPELPRIIKEKEDVKRRQIIRERSRSMAEQILNRIDQVIMTPAFSSITQVSSASAQAARPVALQHLSQMILEYAGFRITVEELGQNMMQVLEIYQESQLEQIYTDSRKVLDKVLEKSAAGAVILRNTAKLPEYAKELEPAAIVYRSEEEFSTRQEEKTNQLEHQVNEIVKNIRTVEEKTVFHKEELLEQQKTVVREILKSSPVVWSEGEGASYIRREVQQSMEEQINQNVNQIVNKVYRRLEDRLKTERGRRGLI